MVWREHRELSAFEEGQQDAERKIGYLQEGDYAYMGFESASAAIQSYGESAYELLQRLQSENGDPEHIELLQGYLSRFD